MIQLDPSIALTAGAMLAGGVAAFVTVRTKQTSFEKHCGEKFGELAGELAGIRRDLKPIVEFMHQTIGERRAQEEHGRRVGRRWNDDYPLPEDR